MLVLELGGRQILCSPTDLIGRPAHSPCSLWLIHFSIEATIFNVIFDILRRSVIRRLRRCRQICSLFFAVDCLSRRSVDAVDVLCTTAGSSTDDGRLSLRCRETFQLGA